MERRLEVFVDRGTPMLAGQLWARVRGASQSASFEYTPAWIRDGFELDPELPLGAGRFHTARALFNAFSDPAPDRWGQVLLRRLERSRARAEGRAPRTLFAIDFLTLVDDTTRLGALRFRDPGSEQFLTSGGRVPPLVALPRLLRATSAILADEATDDDLALLLAPGTALGGARPKASVRDSDGRLAFAKFPGRDDEWPVTRWEAATLAMAAAAGIEVPTHRLATVVKKPVLVLHRFDREREHRVPYMSALTALAAHDGELRSYIEVADVLRTFGAEVQTDLPQLWRRIVFNILVSNTDDHLRNHGFLRTGSGWRLAPAFDLNPMPPDVRPRVHALAIDETDPTASIERALSIVPSFGLSVADARRFARDVAGVTARWRSFAEGHGISKRQADRMEAAFVHEDFEHARRL